jgi:hypothetical protein
MRLSEKLVSCKSDDTSQTKIVEKGYKQRRNAAPYNVDLVDEILECGWLWLLESAHDTCRSRGVEEGLNENDSSQPPMQKVEGLVGNAGYECENGFPR